MAKWKCPLTWLILAALIALAPHVLTNLPISQRETLLDRHQSFAGVLRFWVCEGFEPGNGTLHNWLLGRVRRFERRNPGIYVQITHVAPEAIRNFTGDGVNPPDIILFAPGMLDHANHLLPLDVPDSIRPPLRASGSEGAVTYALPVAMGGYGWTVNRAMLKSGIPDRWTEISRPSRTGGRGGIMPFLTDAPRDGAFLSWSAALVALSVRAQNPPDVIPPKAGEGVDLGLVDAPTPAPTAEARSTELMSAGLPEDLPETFRQIESVYSAFTGGRAAAIPVTQREIQRLHTLSETGRAPDWTVETSAAAWTDQLALVAVVDWPREELAERQALCLQFLDSLLTEEAQQALEGVKAFPVIDTPPLYPARQGMAQIERALVSDALKTPPAFGDWRAKARGLGDRFEAGEIDAVAGWEALCSW